MLFIDLIELGIFILILAFLYTQIVKPYFKGTRFFPGVLKERKLRNEILDLNQKVQEKELKKEIETIKKEKGVK